MYIYIYICIYIYVFVYAACVYTHINVVQNVLYYIYAIHNYILYYFLRIYKHTGGESVYVCIYIYTYIVCVQTSKDNTSRMAYLEPPTDTRTWASGRAPCRARSTTSAGKTNHDGPKGPQKQKATSVENNVMDGKAM